MARMPGVAAFLGIADNGTMSRWDVVCIHTIVGYASGGNAAHFTTAANGRIVQARDTAHRSAANLNGNHRVIAIENEDHGPAYGNWNTGDGHAVPGFTDAQCEAIARICVWAHQAHGIPLVLCPDSKPGSRGIGYHRQGIDGAFRAGGYAYGGRVTGGEVWTKSAGKVCPGDRRITQLIQTIIPRARVLAGIDQEDDVALTDQFSFSDPDGKKIAVTYGQAIQFLYQVTAYGSGSEPWKGPSIVAHLKNLAARPVAVGADVNELELATQLAPLLVPSMRQLSDSDLQAVAKAAADESDRRARDGNPNTGPQS